MNRKYCPPGLKGTGGFVPFEDGCPRGGDLLLSITHNECNDIGKAGIYFGRLFISQIRGTFVV